MLLRNVILFGKSCLRSYTCDLKASMGILPRFAELAKASTEAEWAKLVQDACASIEAENIIAIPTDTIYGIAGLAQSDKAIATIYRIKDRDPNKPISICVGDVEDIYQWSHVTVPRTLLSALLPGPVTVVFKRRPELNPHLNPGTDLLGLRVPDYGFVRDLVRACGQPLALTSANRSSEPSTVAVQEFECLWPLLELVVDGGRIGGSEQDRLGSTVVNLSEEGQYSIIRQGSAFQDTVSLLEKHGLKESPR